MPRAPCLAAGRAPRRSPAPSYFSPPTRRRSSPVTCWWSTAEPRRRFDRQTKQETGEMTAKPTWRELLAREKPLVLPGAHDALSARLIEMAGFAAYVIGGYPVVGARFGLPD